MAAKRIGLIGAGWVTQHHLEGFRALGPERVQVVAIADPSEKARNGRALTYGIQATYADAAEMLKAEQLDAVDIAAPRELHAPLCLLAARHNLPILCQKPLTPTLTESEALVREIGGRVRLMVHENWRFRPHFRQIKRWLDEGRIGPIRQAIMIVLTSGLIPDADGKMYSVERQPFFATLTRMLLMESLIHEVDAVRFLVGPMTLEAARLARSRHGLPGDDRATMMLTTPSGAAVVIVGDFCAHGHSQRQFDDLDILGEDGAIRLSGTTLELFGRQPEKLALDLEGNYVAAYRDTIGHFLDRLDDGKPFETGPEDNLQTLRIVERAYAIGLTPPARPAA